MKGFLQNVYGYTLKKCVGQETKKLPADTERSDGAFCPFSFQG
jgi:hypothetical protein